MQMITVEEAIEFVESNSQTGINSVKMSLKNVQGFVLSEDVISPIDMPPFRQSAMDGYAVRMHDSEYYHVKGELQAVMDKILHYKKERPFAFSQVLQFQMMQMLSSFRRKQL